MIIRVTSSRDLKTTLGFLCMPYLARYSAVFTALATRLLGVMNTMMERPSPADELESGPATMSAA